MQTSDRSHGLAQATAIKLAGRGTLDRVFKGYPKAPKRVLGLLGEGCGFGGEGLGPHYKGPGSLGYIGFLYIVFYSGPSLRLYSLSLRKGSWAFWGRVRALGAKVWDLTTRVQEP